MKASSIGPVVLLLLGAVLATAGILLPISGYGKVVGITGVVLLLASQLFAYGPERTSPSTALPSDASSRPRVTIWPVFFAGLLLSSTGWRWQFSTRIIPSEPMANFRPEWSETLSFPRR